MKFQLKYNIDLETCTKMLLYACEIVNYISRWCVDVIVVR